MDKKTETVVAVAEEAVKKNLLTPRRLLIVVGGVVIGAGVVLFLQSRKDKMDYDVEETLIVESKKK